MGRAVSEPPPNGSWSEAQRAEWAFIERAYQELQARDGAAESRAWSWKVMAFVLAGVAAGSIIWGHVDRREVVRSLVQQVQVTEEGKVMNVGLPVPVLDYTPEDAQWYDMLGLWVQKVRSRSPGPDMTLARTNWRWAYLHSCGAGMAFLKDYEEQVKPFTPQHKTISVELLGHNKTLVPLTYHVYWRETISEPSKPVQTRTWNTVFTVGRVALSKESELLHNRLGLCVSGFSWSQEASS